MLNLFREENNVLYGVYYIDFYKSFNFGVKCEVL